ncbi:MAG: hypothetical protein JW966_09895 [Anaerolineae bacterium]|nr:hypothetical protein [Anaerolineae bacterium]
MARRLGHFLALAVVTLVLHGATLFEPVSAQTLEDLTIEITYPASGQPLFGVVNITGSAAHSTLFASYTLEYDDLSDPNEQWFLVQERVTQQVHNDVLGTWNTNMVPDGIYQLRLRVFLTDERSDEFVVANLQIANSEPTPVPTVAAESGDATPQMPTPGPSPTSLIEQPPSNNPSADTMAEVNPLANEGSNTNPDSDTSTSTRINISRVRSAFCSGVYLAFGMLVFLGVYTFARRWLRVLSHRAVLPDDKQEGIH